MTKVEKKSYKCPKCSTEYEVMELLSWNSMLGKPNLENQKCPNCGLPYNPDHSDNDDMPQKDKEN